MHCTVQGWGWAQIYFYLDTTVQPVQLLIQLITIWWRKWENWNNIYQSARIHPGQAIIPSLNLNWQFRQWAFSDLYQGYRDLQSWGCKHRFGMLWVGSSCIVSWMRKCEKMWHFSIFQKDTENVGLKDWLIYHLSILKTQEKHCDSELPNCVIMAQISWNKESFSLE